MDPDNNPLIAAMTQLCEALKNDVSAMCAKMDADNKAAFAKYDAAIADAMKKPKRDSEEDLATETAADSVRMRADLQTLRSQVNDLVIKSPRKRSDADRNAFADVQAKCDVAFRSLGERADQPMQGEELLDYTIRLHRGLQRHSKKWGKTELATIARDPSTLQQVCDSIRADAHEAGISPVGMPMFQYREVKA